MATTSPPPRRPPSTARAAASARPTSLSAVRRVPETRESLSASLKQETHHKEQLLVQLQDKDQLVTTYATENTNLQSSLTAAEARLNDLYTEQSRWEAELAQRMEVSEKLRDQVRDLEKEKRDLQRRYNEQTATFEAERQALYDNEQHLKSRIQSLSQSRKRVDSAPRPLSPDALEFPQEQVPAQDKPPSPEPTATHQDFNDPESEPAEMTALKLELSTLSTSYASLQSTLILMQGQLVDLKRVNQELQEENESYMILLREKTLSGQFDLLKQVGGAGSDDDTSDDISTDVDSMRSRKASTLDVVEEESYDDLDSQLPGDLSDEDAPKSSRNSRHHSVPGRKRASSSAHRGGESLAGLPLTGPGLDLAAELGRAENKDILAENTLDERDQQLSKKIKKGRKSSDTTNKENPGEVEVLQKEVKSLKDANKALSLYASKIIDRIIAQEGFEHVLAVDYDKEPTTPQTATPQSKQRPQSVNFGHRIEAASNNVFGKLPDQPPTSRPNAKAQRRSLSFDWKAFSIFNNADKKLEPPASPKPSLRPLTLKPGAMSVMGGVTAGGRKLDNEEDEEDRKERERLHATMKLMGIQPPASPMPSSPLPSSIDRSVSSPGPTASAKVNRRFSLFGSRSNTETPSDSTSVHSTSSFNPPGGLTQEALEHAEAEHSLAVLDAQERELTAEISKGSSGGFTEITRRASRRGRKSAGGSSGSTVWSAGMGAGDD